MSLVNLIDLYVGISKQVQTLLSGENLISHVDLIWKIYLSNLEN